MNKTKIEWCDYTWNPVTGCYHGCDYCYARRIAEGFKSKNQEDIKTCEIFEGKQIHAVNRSKEPYPLGFVPTLHPDRLDEPSKLKKPSRIFVVSMGDLFGGWVPDEWIEQVFEACKKAPYHKYMFLTKNPKRYSEVFRTDLDFREYMWLGTTITSNADIKRAWELLKLPKKVNTYLSMEPLLGEIDLDEYELLLEDWRNKATLGKYIDWIIVGAQTGPGAVAPKGIWIRNIIEQARAAGVPIFIKDNLRWPEKIREFPENL